MSENKRIGRFKVTYEFIKSPGALDRMLKIFPGMTVTREREKELCRMYYGTSEYFKVQESIPNSINDYPLYCIRFGRDGDDITVTAEEYKEVPFDGNWDMF